MLFKKRSCRSVALACLAAPLAVYCQSTAITSTSAANYRSIVAPSSLVAGWGSGFTATTVSANSSPPVTLPNSLAGLSISGVDSAGAPFNPGLYLVSPGQINFVLPDKVALGRAVINTNSGGFTGVVYISNVAPAILTADGSGKGVPAAQILRVNSTTGQSTLEAPFLSGTSTYQPAPISVSASDRVFLVLYGTGIRNHSLNPVIALINGVQVPVQYAGLQSTYPGLDQINLGPLPATLAGSGTVDGVLIVDGVPANTFQVAFR